MHKKRPSKVAIGSRHTQVVMGLLERTAGDKHSTVRLAHIPNTRMDSMGAKIRKHVEESSVPYTDKHPTYRELQREQFCDHYTYAAVDHALRYVDGQVHSNGLDNFWSLLKRTIGGTYVSADAFHLFRFLDEQAYRFNARKSNDAQRFVGARRDIVGKRLTYQELISADMLPATT